MKKFLLAAAIMSAASASFAGGLAEPAMEPADVAEKTSSSSGGILIPLLLLILVAVAISGGDDAEVAR